MRIRLLSLLVLSWGISARGATILDFEIVNGSSLGVSGGLFTSGGGTYSGSFQVDVSQIPPGGSRIDFPLTSWDIFTTGPSQFDMEFVPSNSNGSFIAQTEQNLTNLGFPNFGFVQVDSILLQRTVGDNVFQLTLSMLEPVGKFRGGVVLDATDTETNFVSQPSQFTLSDVFGTGLVIDPALVAPEPGGGLLLAAGLGLFAAVRRRLSAGR
jgi:hypothetical protein